MSDLSIELRRLRPLPSALRGMACSRCSKAHTSWWMDVPFEGEQKVYICALCVLYDSDWGNSERAMVEETMLEVQKTRPVDFPKDDNNRLTRARDADDVLGVIVLSARVRGIQATTKAWSK